MAVPVISKQSFDQLRFIATFPRLLKSRSSEELSSSSVSLDTVKPQRVSETEVRLCESEWSMGRCIVVWLKVVSRVVVPSCSSCEAFESCVLSTDVHRTVVVDIPILSPTVGKRKKDEN